MQLLFYSQVINFFPPRHAIFSLYSVFKPQILPPTILNSIIAVSPNPTSPNICSILVGFQISPTSVAIILLLWFLCKTCPLLNTEFYISGLSLMVVLLLVKDEVWGSTHRICGIKDCLVNCGGGGGGGGGCKEEYRVLHQLIY
jgi:hypothetical protein